MRRMIYVYFALSILMFGEVARVVDSDLLHRHLDGKPRRVWLVTLDCLVLFGWSVGFLVAGIVEGVA